MTNENIRNVHNVSELNVEKLLEAYLEPYKNEIRLRSKMSVKDVFNLPQAVDRDVFTYYLMAHFDFVICSISSNKPLFAIEYDGPCHDEEDGERRDGLKNYLCELSGFTLMRISYTSELKDTVRIIEYLKQLANISQVSSSTIPAVNYTQQPSYLPTAPKAKRFSRRKEHSSSSRRKKYNVSFGDILYMLYSAFQKTIIYRIFNGYVRIVTFFIIIGLIFLGVQEIRTNLNSDMKQNNPASVSANIESKSSDVNINSVLVLSFVVGKHPNSRGTFIEINDGKKTIVSAIYKKGTKMEFYKNKKVIVTKAGSAPKTFQLVKNVINLEVANNYTKVFHSGKAYTGLRKFKYDFEEDKIVKK